MSTVTTSPNPAAGRVIRAVGGAAEAAAARERQILEQARREAEHLLDQARREADAIRQQAIQDQTIQDRASTLASDESSVARQAVALQELGRNLEALRHDWLVRWEQALVPLALAIAERIVRRAVQECPAITLDLVRESLELAASGGRVRIALHPEDEANLAAEVQLVASRLGRLADVEVVADPDVDRGGCLVTTDYGQIDQRLTTQLNRLAEELA